MRTFRWPFRHAFAGRAGASCSCSITAMVGRLGALPLAAVSFGGAVFVIFLFWGTGLSMGLTPLVGEMYARRDYRSSGPAASRMR
ncbi:MAG: MATE family efflux transporter [Alistipes indistinctus]